VSANSSTRIEKRSFQEISSTIFREIGGVSGGKHLKKRGSLREMSPALLRKIG